MFYEKTMEILRRFVEERHGGVTSHASSELGINNDTLDKWLKGQRDPQLSKIGLVMDKILWQSATPEKLETLEVRFPVAEKSESSDAQKVENMTAEIAYLKEELTKVRAQKEAIENLFLKVQSGNGVAVEKRTA